MLKEIEKATIKITQAMEKNRLAYAEADECYKDTGYDRYFKKMNKLDAEYEEYKAFLHIDDEPDLDQECSNIKEIDELRRTISTVKSKLFYLSKDLPQCAELVSLRELLMDY